ncbi:MAG: hypothetical protein AAFO91_12835, partial [Bacteroidota bacterium]
MSAQIEEMQRVQDSLEASAHDQTSIGVYDTTIIDVAVQKPAQELGDSSLTTFTTSNRNKNPVYDVSNCANSNLLNNNKISQWSFQKPPVNIAKLKKRAQELEMRERGLETGEIQMQESLECFD